MPWKIHYKYLGYTRKLLHQQSTHALPYDHESSEYLDLEWQLQRAILREDYERAAELQRRLDVLDLKLRSRQIQEEREKIKFQIGTVIFHARYGYRGLIVGYDTTCNAPESWCRAMRVELLSQGKHQPFYHVLVDARDRPGGQMTYVAQENMHMGSHVHIDHPWVDRFFHVEKDERGKITYIPKPELRNLYLKE